MINIRTIRKLAENDGLTLKNGKIIRYKTGGKLLLRALYAILRKMQLKRLRHTAETAAFGLKMVSTTLIRAIE